MPPFAAAPEVLGMRVLITGMSGTGKSAVVNQLLARGHDAIDMDDPGHGLSYVRSDRATVWNTEAVAALLAESDRATLFLAGCSEEQVQFLSEFDHVVLLSAPERVLRQRLVDRTGNPYGKTPEQLAEVMDNMRTVEPLLRQTATVEIDTSAPLAMVVAQILALVDRKGRFPSVRSCR